MAAAAAVVDAEAVDAEAAARARRARHTLFELVHRVSSTKRSKIRYCTGTGNALTPFRILVKVKLPQAFAPTRQVVNKWRARLHTDCGPQLKSTIPWIRCGRLKGLLKGKLKGLLSTATTGRHSAFRAFDSRRGTTRNPPESG